MFNPYEAPVDCEKGVFDYSLAKRVFFACLILAVWFALLAAIYNWQWMVSGGRLEGLTLWEKLEMFFIDWTWRP